jgi:hypothetical protein
MPIHTTASCPSPTTEHDFGRGSRDNTGAAAKFDRWRTRMLGVGLTFVVLKGPQKRRAQKKRRRMCDALSLCLTGPAARVAAVRSTVIDLLHSVLLNSTALLALLFAQAWLVSSAPRCVSWALMKHTLKSWLASAPFARGPL